MFAYELSLFEFGSSSSHLNFRFRACFEQGVPWHSGNYRVWIYSETCTWHDKNVQSLEKVVKSVQKTHQNDVSSVSIVDFEQVNIGWEIISLIFRMFQRKLKSFKVTHICLVAMAFYKNEGGWSKRKITRFNNRWKNWVNVMRNNVIYEIYFVSVKKQSPGGVL